MKRQIIHKELTDAFCTNASCPFKECNKHLQRLKESGVKSGYVRVAALDSTCIEYLRYLVDEVISWKR